MYVIYNIILNCYCSNIIRMSDVRCEMHNASTMMKYDDEIR